MHSSLSHNVAQITCLYDMDIVFRPDGNFDEVYLYVCASSPPIHLPNYQIDAHISVY